MRCRACGATNPDNARWCGQCYASFTQPEPAGTAREAAAAPTQPPGPDPAGDTAPIRPGFRTTGDQVEWQCPRCDAYTSVDQLACRVCGTPLAARYEDEGTQAEPNWTAALALSAAAPGAGHLAVAHYGSGVARLVLFTVWLAGGILLSASGGARALPAAAPLYLGALALWAGSLLDLYQLQRGDRELLSGRGLLWLVVGVFLLSMVGMFALAGGGPGAGG